MKFLADENVRRRLALWLQELGYDVATAGKGIKNSALFALSKKEQRTLITNDTDFLDTKRYVPASTKGRIILRIFPDTFENQRRNLEKFLPKLTEKGCRGKVIELRENEWEARTK